MKSAPAVLLVTVAAVFASSHDFRQLSADCPELCDGAGCNLEPEDCGVLGGKEVCDHRVCYKGPGEECGLYYNKHGLCAPSLRCEHSKCKGCVFVNGVKNCSLWDHRDVTEHGNRLINRYRNSYGY